MRISQIYILDTQDFVAFRVKSSVLIIKKTGLVVCFAMNYWDCGVVYKLVVLTRLVSSFTAGH
jgi:hypothetical protein